MAETLEATKKRLARTYLGLYGIHSVVMGKDCIHIWTSEDSSTQKAAMETIKAEAAPYEVVVTLGKSDRAVVIERVLNWPSGFKLATLKGEIDKKMALAEIVNQTDLGKNIIEIETRVMRMEAEEKTILG